MTDTVTKTKPMTAVEFAKRFNRVVRGEATYDEISQSVKFEPAVTFKVGEKVPATRKGIAVYNGLSYNAMLSREKAYRKAGVALAELKNGKRGRTTDVASINEELAAEVAATDMTKDSEAV